MENENEYKTSRSSSKEEKEAEKELRMQELREEKELRSEHVRELIEEEKAKPMSDIEEAETIREMEENYQSKLRAKQRPSIIDRARSTVSGLQKSYGEYRERSEKNRQVNERSELAKLDKELAKEERKAIIEQLKEKRNSMAYNTLQRKIKNITTPPAPLRIGASILSGAMSGGSRMRGRSEPSLLQRSSGSMLGAALMGSTSMQGKPRGKFITVIENGRLRRVPVEGGSQEVYRQPKQQISAVQEAILHGSSHYGGKTSALHQALVGSHHGGSFASSALSASNKGRVSLLSGSSRTGSKIKLMSGKKPKFRL